MRPSGSNALASSPDATKTRSGAKRSSAGTTTCSIAARYAPIPEPAGSGMLTVAPRPGPSPTSSTVAPPVRVQPVLVQRDREHVGIAPERRLGAVAVMHVPVDDRDPPDAVCGTQVQRGDRDVAEHAEATAARRLGVMARRSHEGVHGVDPAVEHRIGGDHAATRREPRDLEAARPERRLVARIAPGARARLGEPGEVAGIVQAQDLLVRRRARIERDERARETAGLDQAPEASLRVGRLPVRVRLDRRRPELHVARVVCEVALVEDEPDPPHPASLRTSVGDPGLELLPAAVVDVHLVGERALLRLRHLVRLAGRCARIARPADIIWRGDQHGAIVAIGAASLEQQRASPPPRCEHPPPPPRAGTARSRARPAGAAGARGTRAPRDRRTRSRRAPRGRPRRPRRAPVAEALDHGLPDLRAQVQLVHHRVRAEHGAPGARERAECRALPCCDTPGETEEDQIRRARRPARRPAGSRRRPRRRRRRPTDRARARASRRALPRLPRAPSRRRPPARARARR